jgi:hypothetical protein
MKETLETLELERAKLYQQLQALGDFRPGMIFRSTFANAARTTALVTLAGPNFTVTVASYEPSPSRSPSFTPGT